MKQEEEEGEEEDEDEADEDPGATAEPAMVVTGRACSSRSCPAELTAHSMSCGAPP